MENRTMHQSNAALTLRLWWEKPAANDECASGKLFPGQYYDSETGLHYNYFRTYDPEIGRYRESDPIGQFGGLNTYVYVNNMVTRSYDIKGLFAIQLILECELLDDSLRGLYDKRRKQIDGDYEAKRMAAEEKRTADIERCIRDNEQCKIEKSVKCLPVEDCDDFSYADCIDNVYRRFDESTGELFDRYMRDLNNLHIGFPDYGPGSVNNCGPLH